MSVINKKPLINTILDGLSSSELSSLKACINGQGAAPIFRSLKPISNAHLTTSDYGVKPIKLELAIPLGGMSVYEGYLIYNASMCYVISYASEADQLLTILQIDVNNNKAEIVNGSLSILGLRSELDDATEAEAGEVTQADLEEALENVPAKYEVEYVDQLTSDFLDELNKGDLIIPNGSSVFTCSSKDEQWIILCSLFGDGHRCVTYHKEDNQWVLYEDANYLSLPEPLSTDEGKVPVAQDDGTYGLETISGGMKLYKHTVTLNANYSGDIYTETLIFINTSATSLVGLRLYEIRDYIAGYFVQNKNEEEEFLSLIIGKPTWEDIIVCYSKEYQRVESYVEWDTGVILTDTVTEL